MPGIDPFLMQLFIVPAVVIGVGVFVSSLTKKVVLAPVVTLLLNLLYEIWYAKFYYQYDAIHFSSWNIILPVLSLGIAWIVVTVIKQKKTI